LSGFHSSTFSSSRPKPTVRREILVLIHLLCRRSFHCDGSPSLRLFALGLRANKVRLLGPCCLGGSPSRFIDHLLFVFFLSALGGSPCFRILLPNILIFFCFSLWRSSLFAVRLLVSRGVSSFLLSSHFLASVLVNCPRCAHRWSARSNSRVAFSASAVCVVLTLGSCSVLLANSMLRQPWEESLHSVTVSSALCLFRLAGCPLHSA